MLMISFFFQIKLKTVQGINVFVEGLCFFTFDFKNSFLCSPVFSSNYVTSLLFQLEFECVYGVR